MIFIDKTTQHSQESKQRLENWSLSFRSNGENLEQLYAREGQTGTALWKRISRTVKKRLREDLSIEQDRICCYCGKRLTTLSRIEHFLSKSNKAEFITRVFNYDNLLLSCEGEYFDKLQYANGHLETLEAFAIRKNVTIDELEELNPNKNLNSIGINDKIRFAKDHCDPHKGNNEEDIIDPTKHQNCWEYFNFDYDGGIVFNDKIEDETIKTLVKNSIRVLNLDTEELRRKRKKALDDFTDELQTLIDTFQDFDIRRHFATQFNTKSPFCFVIYHFIQSY